MYILHHLVCEFWSNQLHPQTKSIDFQSSEWYLNDYIGQIQVKVSPYMYIHNHVHFIVQSTVQNLPQRPFETFLCYAPLKHSNFKHNLIFKLRAKFVLSLWTPTLSVKAYTSIPRFNINPWSQPQLMSWGGGCSSKRWRHLTKPWGVASVAIFAIVACDWLDPLHELRMSIHGVTWVALQRNEQKQSYKLISIIHIWLMQNYVRTCVF